MTPNNIWLNLPVKDMARAKAFYRAIGLKENERHAGNDQVGSFLVGPHDFVIMLFPEDVLASYTDLPVTDTAKSAGMLINLGAASRAEVDELAEAVRAAGGTVYTEPKLEQGWMYIFGFADTEGHRWSVLFMEERA